MTTLIRNVLTLQDDALETQDILINHQHIETVAPPGTVPVAGHEAVILGENKLLLPGFVNGHTHSYQVWQRGLIPQLPLELWLADLIDSKPQQLDQYYWGAVSTAVDTPALWRHLHHGPTLRAPGQEHDIVDALCAGLQSRRHPCSDCAE